MKCAILISLRNSETTLDRTFESIRSQTFQDYRIVAIDDGTTDSTSSRLEKWQSAFGSKKFLLLRNEKNIGLTKSLNKGLTYINEPFTARIDADDWWHPEKLRKQIEFLENHRDFGVIGCNYENTDSRKRITVHCPETDKEIKRNIIRKNPFAHSAVVFQTDLIKSLGGYDESIRYGQDYELWLRASSKTRFHNIQETLCFRSSEGETSSEKQNAQMLQCLKTQIRYIRELHRSPAEYRFLLEPLAVLLTPAFIRSLKRKFL